MTDEELLAEYHAGLRGTYIILAHFKKFDHPRQSDLIAAAQYMIRRYLHRITELTAKQKAL